MKLNSGCRLLVGGQAGGERSVYAGGKIVPLVDLVSRSVNWRLEPHHNLTGMDDQLLLPHDAVRPCHRNGHNRHARFDGHYKGAFLEG
jgi:hypothetical protein